MINISLIDEIYDENTNKYATQLQLDFYEEIR